MLTTILKFLVSEPGQALVGLVATTVGGWFGYKKVKDSRWTQLLKLAWDAFRAVKAKGDREKWDNEKRWAEWKKLMGQSLVHAGMKALAGDEEGKLGQLVFLWHQLTKALGADALANMVSPPTTSFVRR